MEKLNYLFCALRNKQHFQRSVVWKVHAHLPGEESAWETRIRSRSETVTPTMWRWCPPKAMSM